MELVPVLLWMRLKADSVLKICLIIRVIRHIHVVEVLLVCHVAGVCLLKRTGDTVVVVVLASTVRAVSDCVVGGKEGLRVSFSSRVRVSDSVVHLL